MIAIVPLLFFVAFFAGIIMIVQAQQKKIQDNFRKIGEEYNLQFSAPPLRWYNQNNFAELNGLLRETYEIRIFMFNKGSGKSKRTYTAYDIRINNPFNRQFEIRNEGIFQKMGKALGMQQDVQVRDEEFDKTFIIKADQEMVAKEILMDPDLRELFLKNQSHFNFEGKLSISGNSIHYECQKVLNTDVNVNSFLASIKLGMALYDRWSSINPR